MPAAYYIYTADPTTTSTYLTDHPYYLAFNAETEGYTEEQTITYENGYVARVEARAGSMRVKWDDQYLYPALKATGEQTGTELFYDFESESNAALDAAAHSGSHVMPLSQSSYYVSVLAEADYRVGYWW
ncbi:MAG: hypothetical protein WBB45_16200 [Cyclobacteriaceae bacterium]